MKNSSYSIIQPKYTTGNKNVETRMFDFLDDRTLFTLCRINKTIAELCQDDKLWKRRLLERFPSFHPLKSEDVSYKNYYLKITSQIYNLLESLKIKGTVSNEAQFSEKAEKYEDGETVFENKLRMLYKASHKGYLEILRYLITNHGVDPHDDDEGPLREAAAKGQLSIVKYLIEEANSDPNLDGGYSLIWASAKGKLPVVQYLLEKTPLILSAEKRNEALYMASRKGHLSVLKYLIEKTGSDESNHFRWKTQSLLGASKGGHLDTVKYLIEKVGIDPHEDYDLALVAASGGGHLSVLKYLIEKTRSANHFGWKTRSLFKASKGGHLDIVKYLIEEVGADPHVDHDSALVAASGGGHLDIVKYLIEEQKADPRKRNNEAIKNAIDYGHLSVVRYLVEKAGVDPYANNEEPITAKPLPKLLHKPVVEYLKSLLKN